MTGNCKQFCTFQQDSQEWDFKGVNGLGLTVEIYKRATIPGE